MSRQNTDDLISRLLGALTDLEFGYTPNSGYEMCNSCQEVKRDGQEFNHRDDCKWKAAVSAAQSYLAN